MEIKKNLKAFDIKLSKMASELGVSRPTLDSYIESFEKGNKLSNENYQKIFEYLFSNECKSTIEFAQRYDYVKRTMLADAKTSVHDMKVTEREEELKQKILAEITNNRVNKELLEFINMFINNSEKQLVYDIYMYFAYANGFAKLDTSNIEEKDKALFSMLAKNFANYQNNTITLDEIYFNQLVEKNNKLFEKKQPKVEEDEIIKYIKENISDSSNIDFDKLKEMISARKEAE